MSCSHSELVAFAVYELYLATHSILFLFIHDPGQLHTVGPPSDISLSSVFKVQNNV